MSLRDTALALRNDGLSYYAIGKKLNRDRGTVRRWCCDYANEKSKNSSRKYQKLLRARLSLKGRCIRALEYAKHHAKKHNHAPCLASWEQLADAMKQQNFCCAITGVSDAEERLCADHCHLSGVFRGWISNQCNLSAGWANDDPDLLRKIATYIESK